MRSLHIGVSTALLAMVSLLVPPPATAAPQWSFPLFYAYDAMPLSSLTGLWGGITHLGCGDFHVQSTGAVYYRFGASQALMTGCISAAHTNGAKGLVILSDISGATDNLAACFNTNQATCLTNIQGIITATGADGILVDWETSFPFSNTQATLGTFFSALRTKLGSGVIIVGAAFPSGGTYGVVSETRWNTAAPSVDMVAVMTYDMVIGGNTSGFAWFNSPLYNGSTPDATAQSFDQNKRLWLGSGSAVPASKLLLSIPFYGYTLNGYTAPRQTSGGSVGGQSNYSALAAAHDLSTATYDASAHVPWLPLTGGGYITFDNAQSVTEKVNYVIANGLAGTMSFNLFADYISSGVTPAQKHPLLAAIQAALAPACTISTSSLPGGQVNVAYSQTLAQTGCTGSWSISSGTLPNGLTLNTSTGVISGTPTASGTSSFTVAIGTATQPLSIAVVGACVVNTASLPSGTPGTAYSQTLSASNCTGAWSITTGALPNGLTLNTSTGVISGTPTATGTSNFTVAIGTATKALSIAVAPGFTCTNNSATDPSGIQAAIASAAGGGGTAIIVGTCNLGGTIINIPAGITIQGSGSSGASVGASSNTYLNYTGNNAAFSVNGDNVTITGLTINGGGVNVTPSPQVNGFHFLHDTIQNTHGKNGIVFNGIVSLADIEFNLFYYIAPDNTLTNGPAIFGFGSTPNCYTSGPSCDSLALGAGIIISAGLDQTLIQYNKFDVLGADSVHVGWNFLAVTGGAQTKNSSISYNDLGRQHRIGLEVQDTWYATCGPAGNQACNYNLHTTTNLKIAGNYYHDPIVTYSNSYAYSLVAANDNSLYINNTGIIPNTVASYNGAGYGIEDGSYGAHTQGNVIATDPGRGFSTYIMIGTSQAGSTVYFQNNTLCGPNAGTAAFSYEGNPNGTEVRNANYTNAACPNAGSLQTSSISDVFTSANNQTFPSGGNGTWNSYVLSNLSIRNVSYFIDGATSPIVSQELSDVNSNFANDRKWTYHATFNTSTLTSGSHTISAIATDASGATATTTQSFTVGGTASPVAQFAPTSLTYSAGGPQTAVLSNAGSASMTISAATLTGTNPGDYSFTTTCGATLAAGASCNYVVTFSPTTTGTRTATLNVPNNSGNNPATVALSGFTSPSATLLLQQAVVPSGGITVPPSVTLQPSSVTVSAWIRATPASNNFPAYVSYGNDTSPTFESYILQASSVDGTSPANFYVSTSATASIFLSGHTLLAAGTQYFLAGVYDGNTASLYVNGVLDASIQVAGSIFYPAGVGGLGLGRKYTAGANVFNGLIQNVSIYSGALSPAAVTALFNSGPGTIPACATMPSACTVTGGNAVTLVAPSAATWSLVNGSIGTLTTIDSTHAVYDPPYPFAEANNTLGGCLVMPNDSIYNTRIDALPVHASSTTWTNEWAVLEGSIGIGWQPSWDPNTIDNTTNTIASPLWYYTPNYTAAFQVPNDINRLRENGAIAQGTGGFSVNADHHMVSINHQTCQIYETYQDQIPVAGIARGQSGNTCNQGLGVNTGCTAQSAWQYNGTSYDVPTNNATAAAGAPILPTTWRAQEVRSGAITHALRLTVAQGLCGAGFIWPATGTTCGGAPGAPPMGARFRMKASATCPQASASATAMCTALKRYGFFVDDVTSGISLTTSQDLYYDPVVKAIWTGSFNIPIASVEAVDESSLRLSATSYAVNPNNTFVVPSNSAVVSYGTNLYQPVALVPVTVGTTEPYIALLSGFTYAPPVWVNGTTNTAVTWTATAGSFSGGIYTPPVVTFGGNTAVTLTACSAVDSAACTSIYATVLPSKCKSSDTTVRVCIDSGAITGYGPDANGDFWSADAVPTGGAESFSSSNPGWNVETDGTLYYTGLGATDIVYHFANVPTANYKLTYLQGKGYDNSGNPVCNFNGGWPSTYYVPGINSNSYGLSPWPGAQGNPMFLGAQGVLTNNLYDPGLAYPTNNGYQCFVRSQVSLPATVSDGTLTPGLYSYWDQYAQYPPWLQALKVEQDSTPAFLSIDLATQRPVLLPNNTIQLQPQFWYTPATSVTWSIVANPDGSTGPGSINSTGLFTAPPSVTVTRPTTVQAADTNGHLATTTITVQGLQHPALVY